MDFSEALKYVKEGKNTRRNSWNKDKYIYLTKSTELQNCMKYGYGEYESEPTITDTICLKNEENKIIFGWTPSIEDMLADDWSWFDNNNYNNISIIDKIIINVSYQFDCEIKLYEKINPEIQYMISLTATVDLDNVIIQIINPLTKNLVGGSEIEHCTVKNIAKILTDLVSEYIPKSTIVIERNSIGSVIIGCLMTTGIRCNLFIDKNISDIVCYGLVLNKHVRDEIFNIYLSEMNADKLDSTMKKSFDILFSVTGTDIEGFCVFKTYLIGLYAINKLNE